jgi:hypothetical protein
MRETLARLNTDATVNVANPQFAAWAQSHAGCDGGDWGSPARPAIWLCGIEWGGAPTAQTLQRAMQQPVLSPSVGYPHAADNLGFAYNRQALKLLAAIDGRRVNEYRSWCEQARPFTRRAPGEQGEQREPGHCKLNLFPLAFRNTKPAHWRSEHAALTGLADKNAYLTWCRTHRLPRLRAWAAQAQPQLIVCVGKSHRQDFKLAFHDAAASFQHRELAGRDLWWARNVQGTLVVIAPFLLGPRGLNQNSTLQLFGEHIAQLLREA